MAKSAGIGWRFSVFALLSMAKPPMSKETEDLATVVRKLVATVMWLSGTNVRSASSRWVPACACGAHQRRNRGADGGFVHRTAWRLAKLIRRSWRLLSLTLRVTIWRWWCLVREKSQVVATGETVVEAREEIAGRVMSAWKDLREWARLLWSRLCGFVGFSDGETW